jgi:xanthine phosphoribosyltransferase
MEQLKNRILKDGKVLEGNVLKVDGFLNHQIDTELIAAIGKEIYNRFCTEKITKVLTVEASGIGVSCFAAKEFGVPCLFAKKSKINKNMSAGTYSASVESFTHGNINNIVVSKDFLNSDDKVLVVDDFLAHGKALEGLINIIDQAGAEYVGAVAVIEKGYQHGGDKLREQGYRIESLANIDSMDAKTGKIVFRD